ncbi:MAG: DUF4453 domain-containing protein [Maritimibacter sp.]|uniref:DUF4453 domain-containing protein n=1 Tax=Maritimibacter sp. TaxID=2003363 RepID=UPI001D491164|nr:DUF4453 domain-containing protein [Maritimibacter sp.]MBL6428097.1 DUF4453 domain-containing protein [Maritimibacter sp.]
MLRFAAPLFAVLTPLPAVADACDEMWFIRNLHFDRAGYCFGSTLGQNIFDNAGCTGKDVQLSSEAQKSIAFIKEMEGLHGCKVNTAGERIDLYYDYMLRALEDLPVPSEFGSACIGWKGPDVPVLAGHRAGAAQIGTVKRGMDVMWDYEHFGPNGWQVVSLYDGSDRVGIGWVQGGIDEAQCGQLAG